MIEVEVIETGDWIEAEDEVAAVHAARIIGQEARDLSEIPYPTLRFSVDGDVVREVSLTELGQ